jgi:hypothetical protein
VVVKEDARLVVPEDVLVNLLDNPVVVLLLDVIVFVEDAPVLV